MSYSQQNNPGRQKWIREKPLFKTTLRSGKSAPPAIDSKQKLRKSLQAAMVVEHFTIPPYLTALYSIKEGTNDDAVNIIRTVAVEEMLHMVMVANLMNALGFEPQMKGRDVIRSYPDVLPNSSRDFTVSLLKFSKESINTFLRIERPAKEGAHAETGDFHSIGQFYEAVREGLVYLEDKEQQKGKTLFTGSTEKQITAGDYYGAGGKIITVLDLDDAHQVIDEIQGQGEGIDGTINAPMEAEELAHYFRFNQIFYERSYKWGDAANKPPAGKPLKVDWDCVYNMEPNPKMKNYAKYPWLLEKEMDFNKTYNRLLESLHNACNGNPKLLREVAVPLMFQLKLQAVELMKIPSGNGNYSAGPSFEYVKV